MYRLTMNLGDPTEARIYYLPHVLAERLGFFAGQGLRVEAVQSLSGGQTVNGGQIPSVLDGSADLTIGGPMVTMKLAEEGQRLVSFAAAVRSNPWVVLAREPVPGFALSDLAGQRVFDLAKIGTAGFIFDAVMAEQGIAAERVEPEAAATVGDFLASDMDFAIHHLHAAAPLMAEGRIHALCSLAGATGGVPWSAYIARPGAIDAGPQAFAAFTRAIAQALAWLAEADAGKVAETVAPAFPDLAPEVIARIVDLYRTAGLWPQDHRIPAGDMLRFGRLLKASGWLRELPDPAGLTRDLLAEAANA
ncbi:ABC transporter substrate-binding protein [Mangrovicoccus ximenensis]|uniref:ABC transporter substrate-binding protein n=1 Tax=Mangrovicoccus ximenensis TaxID=1911570 RepID=UPI000D386AC5|nr:ABC transporter substrate-binding protein [Mangrovicoccus ximenensis]